MKKSASGAGAMRISPSAPTPLRRSHSAAIVSRFKRIRSATSWIITKSFPVPWYLENCIRLLLDVRGRNRLNRRPCLIPSKIRLDLLHHLERAFLARTKPLGAGVASKPCHLPTRQRLRPAGRRGYRLALANHALETGGRFSVADRLTGGQEGTESPLHQLPGLLEQPGHHGQNPQFDPSMESCAREVDAGSPDGALRVGIPVSGERREGPSGDGRNLQGSYGATRVGGFDPASRFRIEALQASVEGLSPEQGRLSLQKRSCRPHRSREFQPIDDRSVVQAAAPDEQGARTSRLDVSHRLPCYMLYAGHRERLHRIHQIDEVMRNSLALLLSGLGRPDLHLAIDKHRIDAHDLRPERLRDRDRRLGLPRRRRPHQCNERL